MSALQISRPKRRRASELPHPPEINHDLPRVPGVQTLRPRQEARQAEEVQGEQMTDATTVLASKVYPKLGSKESIARHAERLRLQALRDLHAKVAAA